MFAVKYFKVFSKTLLSSDQWPYATLRWLVSQILFCLGAIVGPINSGTASFLKIYACVLAFDPDHCVMQINSKDVKNNTHLIIASRAFFEIAFARGELSKICNFLKKMTTYFPYLFVPWKLLHYCYYFTNSWESLLRVNAVYEEFRAKQIESARVHGYDVIFGDHVTGSIGHSQIFFDFQILHSLGLISRPKIAICLSSRDRMSSFYRELIPDVIQEIISVAISPSHSPDLVNFVQDSFPFLVTKKYFAYKEERGRAQYLASWAATGSRAFRLTAHQTNELEMFLQGFGLGEVDWYVVIHVREGADNSIRNADINTYYGAIEAIISNGGWVFRIGDASMTPLRKGLQRVIDLPFNNISKPSYINLYLLATARFVICTASGPSDFPFYFNVPRLVTNWPVMYALFGTPNDICIPVSYYCKSKNTIISLREQLTSAVYESNSTLQALKSVRSIKNSSKQIEYTAIEMIELTARNIERTYFSIPTSDSLKHKFDDVFWFMGSISKVFLKDNPNYLE